MSAEAREKLRGSPENIKPRKQDLKGRLTNEDVRWVRFQNTFYSFPRYPN